MSEDFRQAIAALSAPASSNRSVTSDLTIDESLLLHGAGYEPTDLVTGTSVQSIPWGTFQIPFGQGSPVEIPAATRAVLDAFRLSSERLRHEAAQSGGLGVVGVEVAIEVESMSASVSFTGTAIRRIGTQPRVQGRPFVTDLSVRDFVLLERAGWEPLDLTVGASFVGAPLQGIRQFLSQANQNVELVNLTQALQDAREKAMERMQSDALAAGASGVVDVSILDGPLGHSRHVLAFICYGTSLHLVADEHQRIEPDLVLPLDDRAGLFKASALR